MKEIKEALKNQKGSDALQRVERLRKDSAYTWNPKLLQYAVEACRMLNDQENEKIYLRSKPDTAAFFSTLAKVYDYALLTDSAERIQNFSHSENPLDAKSQKYRYRKQNADFAASHYRNLTAGSRYFGTHGKWEEAKRFTALAIEVATAPMTYALRQPVADSSRINDLALLHLNACYRQKQYADMERYAEYALRDSANRESTLEKLIFAETELADTLHYVARLKEAHNYAPSNMFFFSRLVDYYLRNFDNEAVLNTANLTLEHVLNNAQMEADKCVIDSLDYYSQPSDAEALEGVRTSVTLPDAEIAQIFEARAIAYHNSDNPRDCINEALNILEWEPNHPRADFYIGASYYRMAESIAIPQHVTDDDYQRATRERNRLLALARPHLEAYRYNNPDAADFWAPLLYETYLYLNLGPEFEEISHYIK